MLEQKELIEAIEALLPKYHEYINSGDARLTIEEVSKIEAIARQLIPGFQMNRTCPGCVRNTLEWLISYHQREYPKWIATQEANKPEVKEEPVKNVSQGRTARVRKPKAGTT